MCVNRRKRTLEHKAENFERNTIFEKKNTKSMKVNSLLFSPLEVALEKSADFSRAVIDLQCIE